MDVDQKIRQLAAERGWTEYRLVKEAGLSASTIANIYHRGTIPGIPTLEILCQAFGISLSQFFSTGNVISLTEEQRVLLEHWACLSSEQREILLRLLQTMREAKNGSSQDP